MNTSSKRTESTGTAGIKTVSRSIVAMIMAIGIFVLIAAAAASFASASALATPQQDLDDAQARWAANGPTDYQYSYTFGVLAGQPLVPAVFTVSNNTVTAISQPADIPTQYTTGLTIVDHFAAIQQSITDGDTITVSYDATDGHPTSFVISARGDGSPLPQGAGIDLVVSGLISGTTPLQCAGQNATILGTDGPDSITGSNASDVVVALGGDDTVNGLGGDDVVCGGPGRDRISAGPGADLVYGEGHNDRINGGPDDDTIYGQTGGDTLEGDSGNDRIFGGVGFDRIAGDDGDDFLQGSGGNDYIEGGDGDDALFGKAGDDAMFGDNGDDDLYGAGGNDNMDGGAGDDRIQGAAGNDDLNGGSGDDLLFGQNGNDRLFGQDGNDVLYAAAGNDDLDGGHGVDSLQAGSGDDILIGGNDNDVLFGQAGNDDLNGGGGNNSCYQGAGSGPRVNCDAVTMNLDGEWKFVSGIHDGELIDFSSDSGPLPTLTIDGSTISGNNSCNFYTADVYHEGITFIVGDVVSTDAACLVSIEYPYMGALEDIYAAELLPNGLPVLILIGADSELVFVQ